MEAKVNARNLSISTKQSVEICNLIRDKKVDSAKKTLSRVIEKKQAVPYKRFKRKIPHRAGKMATGRYPIKASKEILNLLDSVIANAQSKGMSSELSISQISANRGANQFHFGRKRRRKMKLTHINLVVKEIKEKKKTEVKKEIKEEKPKEVEKKIEDKKEIKKDDRKTDSVEKG